MRTLKTTCFCWISGLFLLSIVTNIQSAAPLKDTIWIPVTYFDFHSDGSNPEFEQPHNGGLDSNMVNPTLDKDTLPVLGATTNLNKYIKYWYRDWNSPKGSKWVDSIPVYNNGNFVNFKKVTYDTALKIYDTAFRNIVIHDSLPFTRDSLSPQLYQYDNPNFFPLDGRGFGAEGKADDKGVPHNYSFTMSLHYSFTKTKNSIKQTFNFRGDDDVWAFIDNQLALDLGGVHEPLQKRFFVSDTLVPNKKYQFDFFSAERHTVQSNIRIQTNLFVHDPDTILLNIKPSATVKCGDSVKVFAVILSDGDTIKNAGSNISWTLDDSSKNAESTLWGNIVSPGKRIGDIVTFSPTEAYFADGTPAYVIIEATTFDSIKNLPVHSKVRIDILPGDPHHLVIEEKKDVTLKDKLNDNPLGTILFNSSQDQSSAYAIVRDKFGNYIRLADPLITVWGQIKPVISAKGEVDKRYHGILDRKSDEDSTIAFVTEGTLIPDSVNVVLTRKCITELRLTDENGTVVDSIIMHTDDKRTFYAEGLKSNVWSRMPVKWELSPNFISETQPPEQNSLWTFDPKNAGTGKLKLSRPFDTSCIGRPFVIVPVTVILSPPYDVKINILTPVSERIAGDTLTAVIEIRNTDGLIPNEYCFGAGGNETQQVIYQDTLKNPNGDKPPLPRLLVDGVWSNLNMGFTSEVKNNQCFMNGVDTIKFISYFAPYEAKYNQHLLTVDVGKNIKDQEPFSIIPAILDSIDITDANHVSVTSIQTFTSGDVGLAYYSVGYDKFGNKIDDILSDWKTEGEIKSTSMPGSATISFDPGKVDVTQNGVLISEIVVNGKTIRDQIDIRVNALPAKLMSSYTHDDNGNGYLDRLSLSFDKKVTIAEDATSLFTIKNGISNAFKVTKILPVDGDSSKYNVYLEELKTALPQTNWKPLISSNGQSEFNAVNEMSSQDSAAPVVWTAEKTNDPGNVRTNDILVITMSETVRKADNNKFSPSDKPDFTFYVWIKNAQDTTKYDSIPLFEGITGFQGTTDNSFTIKMENGSDITNNNFINIKARDSSLIDNIFRNFPSENNIKRQVVVYSKPVPPVVIPNPTSPSFIHTNPGVLVLSHDAEARTFARNSQGVAISVGLPKTKLGETVKAYIKIYDIAGNIVNTSYNNDFLKVEGSNISDASSNYSIDIYWNGSNAKGMKVAPGIYKTVLYFTYSQHSTANLRWVLNIGIKK